MAFTYDLDNSDTTKADISRIRLEIGDTVEDAGVRPDGRNFTDEEITVLYEDEGSSVGKGAAKVCEVLAREWARVPKTRLGDLNVDPAHMSKTWQAQANQLRKIYGYQQAKAFATQLTRADADTQQA